ncbi:hypothetical protein NCER_100275 [Vairimorpha ceranae BRL01]|uniref:Uncharacterized protein n=1 Tax=Vairimorpha ceranae (strain BRL01) TaxID=578460 RepID=C4V758_VAIC1|nr:hypothetical protein NCER_100275 [Vairimorpha ceranae BRL01]
MSDKKFKWVNDIPLPLPGLCYIEPSLNIDFKDHDNSLETFLPPTIYTDPFELLDVNLMKIVLDDLCGNIEDLGTKKNKIYEKEYDFETYILESFDTVYEYEHPLDKNVKVKSVYDVFYGGDEDKYCVLQSDDLELEEKIFKVEDFSQSDLHKYLVGEKEGAIYEGIQFTNNEYMICKIDEDKMYFYDVMCTFKYKKSTKK